MTGLRESKPLLPRWLAVVVAGVFAGHFAILTIYHFSFEMIPKKYGYVTSHYVRPWFGQNFMVFAPEPWNVRCLFLYRLKDENGWSRWKHPVYPYLQDQWKYRFHASAKMVDLLERMAINFWETQRYFDAQKLDPALRWQRTPTLQSAKAFIRWKEDVSRCDSFQVVILLQPKMVVGDTLQSTDTLIVLPNYAWHD